MIYSVVFHRSKQEGEPDDRRAGPERNLNEEGEPIISPDVPHGGRNDRCPIREEGGREQKVGGYERKSKEENHENKNETQDCMEAERDEELKSIDLLFLSFNIFQEFFSRPTVQTFYVV